MASLQSKRLPLRTKPVVTKTSKTSSSFKIYDENLAQAPKATSKLTNITLNSSKRVALGELNNPSRIPSKSLAGAQLATKKNTTTAKSLASTATRQKSAATITVKTKNAVQPKSKSTLKDMDFEDESLDEDLLLSSGDEQEVDKESALSKAVLDPMEIENLKSEDDYEFWDDSIVDIDADDSEDPQFCTEYVHIIFDYFRKKEEAEQVTPTYMSRQLDLTARHRYVLVDWLAEVSQKFQLMSETLFLTVRYIDRYLSITTINRSQVQLIGVVAMLIASKYEETYHPQVKDFIWISASTYEEKELLLMEQKMFSTLNFTLNDIYPLHFLRRFSRAARSDSTIHTLSKYLTELSLLDYNMLNYLPSMIAASSILIARKMTNTTPHWSKTLEHYTTYTEADIIQCARELNELAKKQHVKSEYRSIFKKYSSKNLLSVALTPTVDF